MGQVSAHVSAPEASCASSRHARGSAEMNCSRPGSDKEGQHGAPHVLPVLVPSVNSLGGGHVDVE